MKRTEVQLSDDLYEQVKGLAARLDMSVEELLREGAQKMVQTGAKHKPASNGDWCFPEGHHLGEFLAESEDWLLLATEATE